MRRALPVVGGVVFVLLIASAHATSPSRDAFARPIGRNGAFASVSCPERDWCQAVGSYVVQNGVEAPLAEGWNGKRWTLERTPNPPHSFGTTLMSVSCSSRTACSAVGWYADSPARPLVERWNGASWQMQSIPYADSAMLSAVSCPQVDRCVAVGSHAGNETLAERWNGSSWTIEPTPNPTNGSSSLTAVSCTTTRTCVAVGEDGTPFGWRALVERWNGEAWTLQAATNPGNSDIHLMGVSCSVAQCTAVGRYGRGPHDPTVATLAERWDGSAWSAMATANPLRFAWLTDAWCRSGNICIAVGDAWVGITTPRTLAEVWNGSRWRVLRTPALRHAQSSSLSSISCTGRTCFAVGSRSTTAFAHPSDEVTLTERWDGTRWQAQPSPNPVG
jgi:hypothetical protein